MENEPNWPYLHDCSSGYVGAMVRCCACAYAEGYKAGRASREGLREAMRVVLEISNDPGVVDVAEVALAEDEKQS